MIIDHKLLSSWSPDGDLYGSCYVLKHTNLIYINIPKNASTWTKSQLSVLGCYNDNYFINSELVKKPTLVIFRDPIERWISGISWYMTSTYEDDLIDKCEKNDFVRSTVMSMVSKKIDFDAHTVPQERFLQCIDFDRTTFIKVQHNNDTFREIFSKFFKNELGINNSFDQTTSQHSAMGNPIQIRWVNFFRSQLDIDLSTQLKKYYLRDIVLFNTIKFYDPR